MTLLNELMVFTSVLGQNVHFADALTFFGCAGLVVLSTKADSGGYFSPGNARDILDLFDKLKPHLIRNFAVPLEHVNDENMVYHTIFGAEDFEEDTIYATFQDCVQTGNIVTTN